jgi:sortase A
MGSVEIPAIGVSLPIYHGVSDEVLAAGVGHVPGSSLPVGGAGTHCVLSGHRGLPSSRLFTDLDRLQTGDLCSSCTCWMRRWPTRWIRSALSSRTIWRFAGHHPGGADLCTLVTCTPYGINTQRLLVRGRRIPYTAAVAAAVGGFSADAVGRRTICWSRLRWPRRSLADPAAGAADPHAAEKEKNGRRRH